MRFDLFDYQREAARDVLNRLSRGLDDWKRHNDPSSFALSAVTGAGKTVIATAVIEAMLYGSADLGVEADPRATFLWVTDDPALNRQTLSKMNAASDLLQRGQLQELDNGFLNSELSPAHVYFLNIQKLSETAGLAHGGRNLRQHSMWDVLANTIDGGTTNLFVVVDEAHKGMKPAKDRATIVQRIISGQAGSNPAVPVVWGISATIERFEAAMKNAVADGKKRTAYPYVQVDIEKVRASGLIKDEIGIDQPDEKGSFGTTLLSEAAKATLDYERRWRDYSEAENEPEVLPILVVQVPDKASDAKLAEMLEVIEEKWPSLGPDAVVHVFGEHEPLDIDDRRVRWVHPESVQGDTSVRVVLAKEAISTGWDCPRAEVLYSERPAKDSTRIAQIIGRMVRQPLAHRVATDDALNSVLCYLPLFDPKALSTIKAELEGGEDVDGDSRVGSSVVRAPKVFEKNSGIASSVFDFMETLPSLPAPDALANPLRRAKQLAKLLTDNASGSALVPDAGERLTKRLNSRLDGLAAEHVDAVADKVKDLRTTDVRRDTLATAGGHHLGTSSRSIITEMRGLERDTRKIIRGVKEGVGQDYFAYRVRKAGAGVDRADTRVEVAALLAVDGVVDEIEAAATKWVQEHLAEHAVAIKNTTGATRDAYLKVQEQSSAPEPVTVELRDNVKTATKDGDGDDLPTFTGHLYSDDDGRFPAKLNSWETEVITTEIGRPSFVAWYRNPAQATHAALRVAYEKDDGRWSSVQPDFVIVSEKDDGTLAASLVDPHSDHLADARAKLVGMADFAEKYGERFLRIDSIAQVADKRLRYLNMQDEKVRKTVRAFKGANVSALFESDTAIDYL